MKYSAKNMTSFNCLLVVSLGNLKSLLNGFLRFYGEIVKIDGFMYLNSSLTKQFSNHK